MNNDPLPTANYTQPLYTQTLDPVGIPAPTNVASGTRTVECGYYYDVQSGDTLASISTRVQLNASVLESWNPQLVSAALVVGSALCVRFPTGNYTLNTASRPANAAPKSTTNCAEWYTVVKGDGCSSIETTYGLTSAQFSQLNREHSYDWLCASLIVSTADINAQCTTLQIGAAYCVLSIYAAGYSTAPVSTGPPSNLASGSFTNCTSYHTVASGDTCNSMEVAASISATDLLRWNPEVNVVTCTNIQLGAAYCIGGGGEYPRTEASWRPSHVFAGNQCSKRYTVASGDYCSKVETTVGLTDAQFRSYNPWLDANCDMQVGQVMCVGPNAGGSTTTSTTSSSTTPPPTTTSSTSTRTTTTTTSSSTSSVPTNLATGSWRNCTTYCKRVILISYFQCTNDFSDNVQTGDTCAKIDTRYNLAYTDFLRWNPEITPTCTSACFISLTAGLG
jgi:LysM repeat protein